MMYMIIYCILPIKRNNESLFLSSETTWKTLDIVLIVLGIYSWSLAVACIVQQGVYERAII